MPPLVPYNAPPNFDWVTKASGWRQQGSRLIVDVATAYEKSAQVIFQAISAHIWRITFTIPGASVTPATPIVVGQFEPPVLTSYEAAPGIEASASGLTLRIAFDPWQITFVDDQGREVCRENPQDIDGLGRLFILPLGFTPDVVTQATVVPSDSLSDAGYANVGQTQIHLMHTGDDQTNYVSLVSETWQPVINADELASKAFVAPASKLGATTAQNVDGVSVQVGTYTPDSGSPYGVAIMVKGSAQSVVMAVSQMQSLRLGQLGGLASARGATFTGIPYRIQDGFADGSGTNSVALVGDPRDMALIVPQSAVTDAFDVNPADLQRDMYAQLSFDGYTEALQTKIGDTFFLTFFRNSFILVILNTIGHLLSCIIVAYAFARLRAPGKGVLFLILLATMMLPFPVTLVPVYEIFNKFGMIDTLWPLFLRSFFGNAFLIFMLRQFFLGIPQELEEAARIDGANVLQIIWNVIVPLSRPAIATVVIFTFWWTWNSFFEPYIYLSSPDLFPVSVGLNFFKDQYGTIYYDRMIAASVMSMIPMLLIFFFAQRYFIEGIQLTGMKS